MFFKKFENQSTGGLEIVVLMKHSLSQDIGLSQHQIQLSSGLSHLSSSRPTFQDGVGLQQLVLDVLVLPAVPSHGGDVLHHQLPGLRLPGPALPGEDDGLVLPAVPELVPGPVRQGVSEEESCHKFAGQNSLTCEAGAG